MRGHAAVMSDESFCYAAGVLNNASCKHRHGGMAAYRSRENFGSLNAQIYAVVLNSGDSGLRNPSQSLQLTLSHPEVLARSEKMPGCVGWPNASTSNRHYGHSVGREGRERGLPASVSIVRREVGCSCR